MINDYFYSLVLVTLLILVIAGHIVLYILTKKKETLLYLFGYAGFLLMSCFVWRSVCSAEHTLR